MPGSGVLGLVLSVQTSEESLWNDQFLYRMEC